MRKHLIDYYILICMLLIVKNFANIINQSNDGDDDVLVEENRHVYAHQQRIFLLSIDGLRNDYIQTYNMKSLQGIIRDGVKAQYLNPQFSTQTLPNLWGLITGTYQETHGVISNQIFDPEYNDLFSRSHYDMKWWNSTEPLWYTASQSGLQSASIHWPGGNLRSYSSNLYKSYEFTHTTSFKHKINHVIRKFLHDNYTFIIMHYNQLDSVSHTYGINSLEFNQTIHDIDNNLIYLIHQLKLHGLYDTVDFNLFIVSTHGMTDVKKNIFFDQLIDKNDAQILSFTSTIVHLKPFVDIGTLMSKLSDIPYVDAYLKADIPERWHYKNNRRIGDVIVVAREGVNLHLTTSIQPSLLSLNTSMEELENLYLEMFDKANHGYDNQLDSMKGVFLATGSAFRHNFQAKQSIENVDVYPLMCYILDLNCNKNNGSFERVEIFLSSQASQSLLYMNTFPYNNSSSSKLILSIYLVFYYVFIVKFCTLL